MKQAHNLLFSLVPILATMEIDPNTVECTPLFDFSKASQVAAWRSVHDEVMGGASTGKPSAVEGAVRFEGRVSLENNGGFASFRLTAELPDLTTYDGLRLGVRGDGQVYKLTLRTDDAWDGVSWQVPFATRAGVETIVDLAFEDLAPTWRGRLVAEARAFDPASIRQVGIVIADKQQGPFALELAAIGAWRSSIAQSADAAARPGTRAAVRTRTRDIVRRLDGGSDAREFTESLRWQERLVVLASPEVLGARGSVQWGQLVSARDGLAARELRIVYLMGAGAGRLAGRTLSSQQVQDLRAQWDLPVDAWSVALVGKDGGVKSRWEQGVGPEQIFAKIDAMPMRRQESGSRR